MRNTNFLIAVVFFLCPTVVHAEVLEVKQGKSAIVKEAPSANAEQFPERLPEGTRVNKIGDAPRYYEIQLADGRIGWSYKGNFQIVEGANPISTTGTTDVTKQSLLARSDVLKIIIIDVEVGDATLIICPEENGKQDVILIDTGEDDSDRIKKELISNGFELSEKPITRMIITHYDTDHCGDAAELIPYSKTIYDHGNNNIKSYYLTAASKPGVDRREMTLDYQETFSGGVDFECVAVNQATDFDPDYESSSSKENANSIALMIAFDGFDYFTGGDLTFKPEKSLAKGIKKQ